MSTNTTQPKSLIEARIVETRDLMFLYSLVIILIPLSSKIIVLETPCTRKIKNRKRRRLEWILKMARNYGCVVTEQTNFDILENPLYLVHLTKEDLEKMTEYDTILIEEIYNEINVRKCGGSNVMEWDKF